VTGTLDVQGNTTLFGILSTSDDAAASLYYSDGSSGTGANLAITLARPAASFSWDRFNASGTATVTAMELSASNQIILNGTASGSIVLDPNAGQITIGGQQVLMDSSALTLTTGGELGIGTTSPAAILDVEGSGNVIFNSDEVGIGGNPADQDDNVDSFTPNGSLVISEPTGAGIRLMSTEAQESDSSGENIDFYDGASGNFVGQIVALNADYPGQGLYQPNEMMFWSGASGGMVFLARNWPNGPGPIIFADGDYASGEVMRIATNQTVSVGGEASPGSLFTVKGNASVGSDYSESSAPDNGLIVEGYVGVGTSSPQYQLDVSGTANFSGPAELAPQGDLPMGNFQSMPPNSGGGGGDGDDDGVFGGGGFRGGGNGAPATTGTGG
jgi:hypothetical protein